MKNHSNTFRYFILSFIKDNFFNKKNKNQIKIFLRNEETILYLATTPSSPLFSVDENVNCPLDLSKTLGLVLILYI